MTTTDSHSATHTGIAGEELAARVLADHEYSVLVTNWQGAAGELDLVALDQGVLVAVEVKTRRRHDYGHPAESVTPAKLRRIQRLLLEWTRTTKPAWMRARRRVDVVAITVDDTLGTKVELLKDVAV